MQIHQKQNRPRENLDFVETSSLTGSALPMYATINKIRLIISMIYPTIKTRIPPMQLSKQPELSVNYIYIIELASRDKVIKMSPRHSFITDKDLNVLC